MGTIRAEHTSYFLGFDNVSYFMASAELALLVHSAQKLKSAPCCFSKLYLVYFSAAAHSCQENSYSIKSETGGKTRQGGGFAFLPLSLPKKPRDFLTREKSLPQFTGGRDFLLYAQVMVKSILATSPRRRGSEGIILFS